MIAFIMTAHQEPMIVARTVAHLAPHPVFVHVDAKAKPDPLWRTVDARFVEPRRPLFWAGFSQLSAILRLLEHALREAGECTYIVMITGACYPLRPVEELERHLEGSGGREFIASMPMPHGTDLRSNIDDVFFRDGLLPWRMIRRYRLAFQADRALRKLLSVLLTGVNRIVGFRRWPVELEPRYGNGNWALTREAGEAVIEFARSAQGRRLLRYMRRIQAPDEVFLQTVVRGLGFQTVSVPYEKFGNYRTANLHVIHPTLGKWYGPDDLEELIGSEKFFVRKVRQAESAALLDALDRHLASRC